MRKRLRQCLVDKETCLGTIVSIPSPEVAEMLSLCEFDWLFIDMEHGVIDGIAVQRILQAVAGRSHCLVRVPQLDEAWIKKALDSGAHGIIVPHICSATEAEKAVAFCRYPPTGIRSVGLARAQGYGNSFDSYLSEANSEIAVVLQIEHIEAVDQIEEIVNVEGIDCLFVGPYDLSASMAMTGQVQEPQVVEAISRVHQCAFAANIPMGIFVATADEAISYISAGYTLITVGVDLMILSGAAQKITRILNKSPSIE
jgi:2-dehydro-3-deoxyglucarate aldolase/4-hydroxy-2-oxoheptanedioate aldolase